MAITPRSEAELSPSRSDEMRKPSAPRDAECCGYGWKSRPSPLGHQDATAIPVLGATRRWTGRGSSMLIVYSASLRVTGSVKGSVTLYASDVPSGAQAKDQT